MSELHTVAEIRGLPDRIRQFKNPNEHHYDSPEFIRDYLFHWMKVVRIFSRYGESVISKSDVEPEVWERLVAEVPYFQKKGHNIKYIKGTLLGERILYSVTTR